MPAEWKDGEDIDREEARREKRRLLDDPKHKRPKGHPDDEVTRDDALDDPAHNAPDE